MEDITRKQLAKELDSSFLKLALEDMKRAIDPKTNTNLAVFILGVCFIEALAGFYFGQEHKDDWKNNPRSGERFRRFVKKYLTKYNKKLYNPKDLWEWLRCGLVHSYVVGGKYSFTNKKKNQHGKLTPKGKLIINDENFYADLKRVYKEFTKDVLTKPAIFKKTKKRYDSLEVMKVGLIKNS